MVFQQSAVFSRFQRFYNSIKLLADMAVLTLAFGAAYGTRFYLGFTYESLPPLEETLTSLAMVLVIFPVAFRQANLYTTNRARTHVVEVFEIFKAVVLGGLIFIGVTYFVRERYSRFTLGLFLGYAFVFVSASRLTFRAISNALRRRGFNTKSILVVGAGALGQRVIETVEHHRELGFKVVGLLSRHESKRGAVIEGVKVLGVVNDIARVLDEHPIDQVIIALPLEDQALVKVLMEELVQRTVDVKVVPDLYQYATLRGGLEEFGGLPIISMQGGPLHGWNLVAKRAFDACVALIGLVITSPLLLLIAALTRLESRGPVLFRQTRTGMDGRVFTMLKFRTMKPDAESGGAQMAVANDPRATRLGAFLRRTSLDEIPQLWNVLKGDMSLVGPRPERPVFIEEFKKQIPRYQLRHKVKAGMTGWAQINGLRGQTSIEKRIEFDLYYIENWSLLLDLRILLRTVFGGFLSKNAY